MTTYNRRQAGCLLFAFGRNAHHAAAQGRGIFSVSRSRAAVARQSHKLKADGAIPSSATNNNHPVVIQSWTASAVLFCLDIGSRFFCFGAIGLMPCWFRSREFS